MVCADVLEYLVDPWTTVSRRRELASPGGAIVASIPTIRSHGALLQIAVGRGFEYESEGIFDRTNLRFLREPPSGP